MSERNDFMLIDEDELEESSIINLYKEFLRVIERDLDDLSPSKAGFTPWTLLAAMGAVVIALFGLGKGVTEAQVGVIAGVFLFAFFLLQWLQFVVNSASADSPVKENRTYHSRDRFGESAPVLAVRFLFLIIAAIVAFGIWGSDWLVIFGYLALVLLVVLHAALAIFFLKDFIAGANPAHKKGKLVWLLLINGAFIGSIVVSFLRLPVLSEATYISFSIGGLLAVLTLLIDLYISVIVPHPVARQLNQLRDDILFRRLKLNEGLLKYRRIKEGALFVEEVGGEFGVLDAKLDERFRNYETMRKIANTIESLLPEENSSKDKIVESLESIAPYMDTFHLAKANLERLNEEIATASQALVTKANTVQQASGDVNSRELMDAYLAGKDKYFQDEFSKLVVDANELDSRRNKLIDRLKTATSDNSGLISKQDKQR